MKKKKREIKKKLKEPKNFKEQTELIKNFRPKAMVKKQTEYVWSVAS